MPGRSLAWGPWLLGAFLLAACATGQPIPDGDAQSQPPPAENTADYESLQGKTLGREFVAAALQQYRVRTEFDVAGTVQDMGREIAAAAGADPETYHFLVVRNPQANAFAIPGGYIFVFDGLLRRLDSEEELAGVLAHEVAHVRHGHFFKDQKKIAAADLAAMAAILLGQADEAVAAFSLAGAASLQLSYSRENEREADIGGVQYLYDAGYDPSGMTRFFAVLLQQERLLLPRNQFTYLSTHPGLAERYDRVQRLIRRRDETPPPRPPDRWERLSATLAADPDHRREVSGSHYFMGEVALKESHYDAALPLLKAALQEFPGSANVLAALAEASLRAGDPQTARQRVKQALAAEPEHVAALFMEGEVAREEKDSDTALSAYLHVVKRAPDHGMAHFRLSQLYRERGDVPRAEYHLARYLRSQFRPAEAFSALKRIDSGDDAALREQVEHEIRDLQEEGV